MRSRFRRTRLLNQNRCQKLPGFLIASLTLAMPSGVLAQEAENPPKEDNWILRTWDRIPHEEREIEWLTGDFNVWSGVASSLVIAGAVNAASGSSPGTGLIAPGQSVNDVAKYGDDIYNLIPGTAYITSLLARDYQGTILMGVHHATSSTVTQFGKGEVKQRRPNDENDTSFPSGHSNTAFVGAAFLQQRYGSRWGVPAFISAIIVAWSRVYSNVHYVNDVVAGASVSMMSAWAIVPPYEAERRARWEDLDRERKLRYEWEMTLNDIEKNLVQSPFGTGDVHSTPLDRDLNEPWANSNIALEYGMNKTQSVFTSFSPWEIRSFGEFSTPVDFAGVTFPENRELRSTHKLFHFGAQYRHTLINTDRFSITAGAGVAAIMAEQELFIVDDTQPNRQGLTADVKENVFYPVVHADFDLKLFWKLYLNAEADFGKAGDNEFTDLSARLKIHFNSKWDVSLGVREYESKIKESNYANDFKRSGPAINFSYAF
jgi:membrane-associated phospholipid phosphatase